MVNNSLRHAARAAVVAVGVAVFLGLPDSASASEPTTWEPGEGLSGLDVLLIYVGIPLGLFVVIALVASINPGKYADSYPVRPPERHDEEWFGGPDELAGDGRGELPECSEATTPGGGASASW